MSCEEHFYTTYRKAPAGVSFCPYRICPIGAHIDHQHGKVTGMTLDKGITIAYEPTGTGIVELVSRNFPGKVQFHIGSVPERQHDWADYLRGAVRSLSREHALMYGINAVIEGSLPIGGLSSSAAVIIAFLAALCEVNGIRLTPQEMILNALWSENVFAGVSVGKLDQSCEVLCRKDHLLYLDTMDDGYELIPNHPDMKPFEIAIFFSGVERSLTGSGYNLRVDEAKSAAYALKAYAGLDYGRHADTRLRDVPRDIYEQYKDRLPENWRRRADHFYTEVERVEQGAEAWRKGDIEAFGQLSFQSGHSSIHSYETGSPQLKLLFEIMHKTDGIYGGRFSGAGFNGCCMALINPAFRDSIQRKIRDEYTRSFPALKDKFSAHFCQTADGYKF